MDTKSRQMNPYNEQYYIIFLNYNDETLYLKPEMRSAMRHYEFTKLPAGEPMFFENGYRDEDLSKGVKRPIKNAHMAINYPVINDDIKKSLGEIGNNFFQLYPAVIVDDERNYHEGFWVFNIFEYMDVLDLENCLIDNFESGQDEYAINEYYLSKKKIEAIPEKDRLVFMPEYSDFPHVMVHEKVVNVFKKHDVDTLKFVKVSDWAMGLQFLES